ncbi:hypothetical protein J2X76_005510 [Neorhizobium sp. 2083]|uniref:hypothetical protein n=1 Tax=Neorhizobium sp. 2083 TaxID=2817762 RepID=UPI00285E9F06|nr:hypothetical protein [Neorhizobium sp. 2083]MDR6820313.1 hypothetical protein [Neorhizobium sp. 2083]
MPQVLGLHVLEHVQKILSGDCRRTPIFQTLDQLTLLQDNCLATTYVASDHVKFGFERGVHSDRIRRVERRGKSLAEALSFGAVSGNGGTRMDDLSLSHEI